MMLPHVHVRKSLCLVYAGIGLKSALSYGPQKGFAILTSSQIAMDVTIIWARFLQINAPAGHVELQLAIVNSVAHVGSFLQLSYIQH